MSKNLRAAASIQAQINPDAQDLSVISFALRKEHAEAALTALNKQISRKVVKTETSSQVCPICKNTVNRAYCGTCGQLLHYK